MEKIMKKYIKICLAIIYLLFVLFIQYFLIILSMIKLPIFDSPLLFLIFYISYNFRIRYT